MARHQPLRNILRGALAPLLLIALLVPAELFAGRPSGSRSGGGGGSKAAAGSSVRQSHVQSSGGSNVNRGSAQRTGSAQATSSAQRPSGAQRTGSAQPTGSAQQRSGSAQRSGDVNIDNSRNVNVEQNVHDRDWSGDVENVAIGEEAAYIQGEEHRAWVSEGEVHVYEDNDGWRLAAGVATGMAIGAMIRTPPPAYTTVVVSGSPYYYAEGSYYTEVYNGGEVAYQVVAPPVGAVVQVLPSGCVDHAVGGVIYKSCGGYYYQPQGSSWVVVRL